MNKVKVLITGYAKQIKGGWLASSTSTLIESGGKKIIVDPGINRELLIRKLKEDGLEKADINCVFMTHYHPDHVFLSAIFEKATFFDDDTIYKNDGELIYQGKIPGTDVRVIKTPGHAHEHASLLIRAGKGNIVIAGDVFWWTDDEKQKTDRKSLLNHQDPFIKDKKALLESRKKLLELADFIIPGHGKMFKVEK